MDCNTMSKSPPRPSWNGAILRNTGAGLERTLGPQAVGDLDHAVKRRLSCFAASARRLNDNLAGIVRAHSLSMLRRKRFSA